MAGGWLRRAFWIVWIKQLPQRQSVDQKVDPRPKTGPLLPLGGHPRDPPAPLNPVITLKTQSTTVNFSAF